MHKEPIRFYSNRAWLKYRYFMFAEAMCTKVMLLNRRIGMTLRSIHDRTTFSCMKFIILSLHNKHLDFSILISKLHCDLLLGLIKARELRIKHL